MKVNNNIAWEISSAYALFVLIIYYKAPLIRVRPLKGPRAKYVPALGSTTRVGRGIRGLNVMHQQFNIQQLYALPTKYLCVLYLSENKQRLVPLTA